MSSIWDATLIISSLRPRGVWGYSRWSYLQPDLLQVADFGLSRRLENNCVHTATFGTVTHMPPELLSHGTLTTAADVYSYGES